MRKRITLSDEQLERVADLRARDVPWSRIGTELGVHRLIVKREYLVWERVQGPAKLSEVRREVAMEDYRRHVEQLTAVAGALDRTIGWVLSEPYWLTKDDPLLASVQQIEELPGAGDDPFSDVDKQRLQRVWSLLYEGLLRHLSGGEWRERRVEWDQKRRRCAEVYADWNRELARRVQGLLGTVTPHVRDVSGEGLAQAFSTAAWSALHGLTPIPVGNTDIRESRWAEIVGPAIRSVEGAVTVARLEAPPGWSLDVRGRRLMEGIEGGEIAESIGKGCTGLLRDTLASNLSRAALGDLQRLREAGEGLAQHLEPLRLRPVLLRTRCEFCPA